MKNVSKAVQNPSGTSVSQVVDDAKTVVTAMTGNPSFPDPMPKLPDVTIISDALEKAFIASRSGDRTQLALVKELKVDLNQKMVALKQYVEMVANQTDGNADSVITSAGFKVKAPLPPRENGFRVVNTGTPGKVFLRDMAVKHGSRKWECKLADDPASQWTEKATTIKSSVYVDGLLSAKYYLFRTATITKDGQGAWSNEVKLLVA